MPTLTTRRPGAARRDGSARWYRTRGWLAACLGLAQSCTGDPTPAPPTGPAAHDHVEQRVRLVLISDLRGVLEPCGCDGTPPAGVDRLVGLVTQLRSEPGALWVVATGELLFGAEPTRDPIGDEQAELKADVMTAVLQRVGPDALVAGSLDMRLGADRLRRVTDAGGGMLLATRGAAAQGAPAPRVATLALRAGWRAGVLLADPNDGQVTQRNLQRLRDQGADPVLLVRAVGSPPPAPGATPDVVLVTGGDPADAPTPEPTAWLPATRDGSAVWLVELTRAGAGATSAPRARGSAQGAWVVTPQMRRLDAHTPSDPQTRRLLDQGFARISARAVELAGASRHRQAGGASGYVGSRTCAACHTRAYLWWAGTGHGRAYESLRARERAFDLACVGCHVTGGAAAGGVPPGDPGELAGVGCESCHGPGGRHVDDPIRVALQPTARVAEGVCRECHDAAHSPTFQYAAYARRMRVPAHGR